MTDEDGDGYYVWGGGPKPTSLPVWVPDLQDGDDSNPDVGGMDHLGWYEDLEGIEHATWDIDFPFVVNYYEAEPCHNINILEGGIFGVISSDIRLVDNCTITVKSGGMLGISHGSLSSANIIVEPGGMLYIENGEINLAENGACKLLEGARMIFYGGRIE